MPEDAQAFNARIMDLHSMTKDQLQAELVAVSARLAQVTRLVAQWRKEADESGTGYSQAHRDCADELTKALAQRAPVKTEAGAGSRPPRPDQETL